MLINKKHTAYATATLSKKNALSPLPLAGEGAGVRVAALSKQAEDHASCGLPPHPRSLSPKGEREEKGKAS